MPRKSPVCTKRTQQTLLACRNGVSEKWQRAGQRGDRAGRLGKDSGHFGLVSLWEMTGQSFTLSTSTNDPSLPVIPNAVATVRITSLAGMPMIEQKIKETTLIALMTTSAETTASAEMRTTAGIPREEGSPPGNPVHSHSLSSV